MTFDEEQILFNLLIRVKDWDSLFDLLFPNVSLEDRLFMAGYSKKYPVGFESPEKAEDVSRAVKIITGAFVMSVAKKN